MARKFIEIERHPVKKGAVVNGQPAFCIQCNILRGDDRRRRRRKAVVTAIDVTDGWRLPVAYCQEHTPDDMFGPHVGTGVIICNACGRPTRDHTLLESCI